MNMYERPDLVQRIEIFDGEHFLEGSLAQASFCYVSSPDGQGMSYLVEGEVFRDAVVAHGGIEVERRDAYPSGYLDDPTTRRIVAIALFGYEGYEQYDEQLKLDEINQSATISLSTSA